MSIRPVNKPALSPEVKLKILETNFADMRAGQLMLIPSQEEIRRIIEETRLGQHLSLKDLRQMLAARAKAEVTCPVTTSIFLRKLIQSECLAHPSMLQSGTEKLRVSLLPFWRVVEPKMPLFKKLDPILQSFIVARRQQEGLE